MITLWWGLETTRYLSRDRVSVMKMEKVRKTWNGVRVREGMREQTNIVASLQVRDEVLLSYVIKTQLKAPKAPYLDLLYRAKPGYISPQMDRQQGR